MVYFNERVLYLNERVLKVHMERLRWSAFKTETRRQSPLASKLDYRYYERLRSAYEAQSDRVSTS